MAQRLIGLEEARARVLEGVRPLPAEPVALAEALGRVLAADVSAPANVPGFDNSAMDGFAVRAQDTVDAPVVLEVVDEARAGHPASAALEAGQAIRISTGAPLPEGADAIVRVEDTQPSGDGRVEVGTSVDRATDVRRAGDDVRAGEAVLGRGTRLGPAELGVLASVGLAQVPCASKPRVAIFTSGDELVQPGEPLPPGAIYDTNLLAVAAQAQRAGATVVRTGTLPDDEQVITDMLGGALDADAVVVCGGVSVGAHDHVKSALRALGVREVFWGVALRPGKPTWFGALERASGRALVFGLPGNPVSAMVTFHLFARPALEALLGAAPGERRVQAIMDESYAKEPGRAHVVRCHAQAREDGWHVRPTGAQASHLLTSMLEADALAFLPADQGPVAAGERVTVELVGPG
jgi:molybdopterin molybdotransferase